MRYYPSDEYGLKITEHQEVPHGITKPNAGVLATIVDDYKLAPGQAVYVGDSLTKDVVMAQVAGVHDVWAAYGVSDARPEYDLLRRVSHWPDDVIKHERATAEGQIEVAPSHTLQIFSGLLELFRFEPANDLG